MTKVFPDLIHTAEYHKFDAAETVRLCEQIISETNNHIWLEGGPTARSSVENKQHQPHLLDYFADYYQWLMPQALDIIINEWGMTPDIRYQVAQSWFNCHYAGDHTLEHHHGASVMSVAHYINFPADSGRLVFRDPCEQNWRAYIRQDNRVDGYYPVDCKTGLTVMFPGWLPHQTEISSSTEPRWVMTSNICCYRAEYINRPL